MKYFFIILSLLSFNTYADHGLRLAESQEFKQMQKEYYSASSRLYIKSGVYEFICKAKSLHHLTPAFEVQGVLKVENGEILSYKFRSDEGPYFINRMLTPDYREKWFFSKVGFNLVSESQSFDMFKIVLRSNTKNKRIYFELTTDQMGASYFYNSYCKKKEDCTWQASYSQKDRLSAGLYVCDTIAAQQ